MTIAHHRHCDDGGDNGGNGNSGGEGDGNGNDGGHDIIMIW